MRKRAALKSPVRKNRTPGSVRGLPGNRQSYLDLHQPAFIQVSMAGTEARRHQEPVGPASLPAIPNVISSIANLYHPTRTSRYCLAMASTENLSAALSKNM